MTKPAKLPRELELRINRLAHQRGHTNRRAYQREKAWLLAQVVTWLASGKTLPEVMVLLPEPRSTRKSKLAHTIEALRRVIAETP